MSKIFFVFSMSIIFVTVVNFKNATRRSSTKVSIRELPISEIIVLSLRHSRKKLNAVRDIISFAAL